MSGSIGLTDNLPRYISYQLKTDFGYSSDTTIIVTNEYIEVKTLGYEPVFHALKDAIKEIKGVTRLTEHGIKLITSDNHPSFYPTPNGLFDNKSNYQKLKDKLREYGYNSKLE